MTKNYVKEYKGHKVPEGATHYRSKSGCYSEGFYKILGKNSHESINFCGVGPTDYWCGGCLSMNDAIELPEASQEWMPNKTIYWVAKVDKYGTPWNSDGPHDNYEDADSSIKILNSLSDNIHIVTEMKFKPIKTQQEKEREAFVEDAARIMVNAANGVINDISLGALFNAGFTAPKEAE